MNKQAWTLGTFLFLLVATIGTTALATTNTTKCFWETNNPTIESGTKGYVQYVDWNRTEAKYIAVPVWDRETLERVARDYSISWVKTTGSTALIHIEKSDLTADERDNNLNILNGLNCKLVYYRCMFNKYNCRSGSWTYT